jgi:DNA-binding LacI/PurR family transcriptional regulator
MRQGRRVNIDTRAWVHTLEISSIDVKTEKKGYFTSFLNQMEKLAAQHGLTILVENVHNEHLQAFMQKRGYAEYKSPGDCGGVPTYWQA